MDAIIPEICKFLLVSFLYFRCVGNDFGLICLLIYIY